MSLKNLNIKISYNSDKDDILNDFYIPALSESVSYKRIGGFFSSSSFALAARGLSKFVQHGGHMQLLVNYLLQKEDKEIIERINTDSEFANNLLSESISEWDLEDEIIRNHVKIFGWMIAHSTLDLKIAITDRPEIFHQKIGIMKDSDGNEISFSGSNNETSLGWKSNIEEFKVFKEWVEEQNKYLQQDKQNFDNFWKGDTKRFLVVDAPTAVLERLIEIAPKDFDDIKNDNGEDNNILLDDNFTQPVKPIKLYDFQKDAIDNWIKNNYKGIFEMATGTGKTFTALGAAKIILENKGQICMIIAVPYKHLVTQWSDEISKFFPRMITINAHSESRGWVEKTNNYLSDYKNGFIKNFAIVISYDSLSSDKFLRIFEKWIDFSKQYILIADEVHNFGSRKRMLGMINNIALRLGLSATPTRWFDEQGTNKIIEYFDKTVFKYDLKMAIDNGFLCHYDYHPIFVKMSDDEMEQYLEFTQKIYNSYRGMQDLENNTYLKLLLIKRSKILKNIKSKLELFEKLILDLKSREMIDHLLVYCDASDQLDIVQKIINKYGIINHKFTQKESNEQRRKILSNFDAGIYKCLVAIKCLDEGVNVPSTKMAIILASTTNPREYIQRRGRVLRKVEGQEKKATIYDFTVLPSDIIDNKIVSTIEKNIFNKELSRIQEFLKTADNKAEILAIINEMMIKYGVYLTSD